MKLKRPNADNLLRMQTNSLLLVGLIALCFSGLAGCTNSEVSTPLPASESQPTKSQSSLRQTQAPTRKTAVDVSKTNRLVEPNWRKNKQISQKDKGRFSESKRITIFNALVQAEDEGIHASVRIQDSQTVSMTQEDIRLLNQRAMQEQESVTEHLTQRIQKKYGLTDSEVSMIRNEGIQKGWTKPYVPVHPRK
jgi:hypothetical protein